MSNEIDVISDGDGLMLLGNPTDIEAFIAEQGLEPGEASRPADIAKVLAAAGTAATIGGDLSANYGRWLKVTKKSAADIKAFGLASSGESGVKYAMVGKAGASKAWVQVVSRPGAALTNPALLANVGALMTQLALQQSIDDIKDYLALIDEKVDDILRAQQDAVLADMIGVGMIVDEAMTIREHTGRVSETTWSKVQSASLTLASVQAYALRQLDAMVEKVEAKPGMGDLADSVAKSEPKIREWLAVIVRCVQLQDAVAVLELDRVLDAEPDELDRHRAGVRAARQRRLDLLARSGDKLLDRLDAALGVSNSKVLFHPAAATTIARHGTRATESVVRVHELLGIESARQPFESVEWKRAAKQLVRSARAAGSEGWSSARDIGTQARGAATDGGDRLAAGVSKATARWRRQRPGPDDNEGRQP